VLTHSDSSTLPRWRPSLINNGEMMILRGNDDLPFFSFSLFCLQEPSDYQQTAWASLPVIEGALRRKGISRWAV
jgi:hypothetical protein